MNNRGLGQHFSGIDERKVLAYFNRPENKAEFNVDREITIADVLTKEGLSFETPLTRLQEMYTSKSFDPSRSSNTKYISRYPSNDQESNDYNVFSNKLRDMCNNLCVMVNGTEYNLRNFAITIQDINPDFVNEEDFKSVHKTPKVEKKRIIKRRPNSNTNEVKTETVSESKPKTEIPTKSETPSKKSFANVVKSKPVKSNNVEKAKNAVVSKNEPQSKNETRSSNEHNNWADAVSDESANNDTQVTVVVTNSRRASYTSNNGAGASSSGSGGTSVRRSSNYEAHVDIDSALGYKPLCMVGEILYNLWYRPGISKEEYTSIVNNNISNVVKTFDNTETNYILTTIKSIYDAGKLFNKSNAEIIAKISEIIVNPLPF